MSRRRTRMLGPRLMVERLEQRETPAIGFGFAIGLGSFGDQMGADVATDPAGNVFLAGSFSGTTDFDPGAGITSLTSAGQNDVFVAKFTGNGSLVWVRAMGGANNDDAVAVALDSVGNILVAGNFSGTMDCDPGAGVTNIVSAGSSDEFVIKLDPSGNFLWGRAMGGLAAELCLGLAVDTAGNVVTKGSFQGTADFDPGAGTLNLVSAGSKDIFVSKLDSAGNLTWAVRMGGPDGDDWAGSGIAIDAAGNVYTTGSFAGTGGSDFDPGAGVFNLTTTSGIDGDIYVSKLDSGGNFVWAVQMGGSGNNDSGNDITVDAAGNVYVIGDFRSSNADFDPGPGTFIMNSGAFLPNMFVVKLDSSANFVWAHQAGNTDDDRALSVAVDAFGNVFTTGFFTGGPSDFDPGAGVANFSSSPSNGPNIMLWQLDSAGNYVSFSQVRAGNYASGIALNSIGDIYLTGGLGGSGDFDPTVGVANLASVNAYDVYLLKLTDSNVAIAPTGGSTVLTEAGVTDTYTVVLNLLPTANVLVTLTPDSQVTTSTTLLTFTPGDWNIPQTVTITAVDDSIAEGAHTGSVQHSDSSADPNYNGRPVASLVAAITDNDTAAVTVTVSGGSTLLAEGGATDTYTVVLTSQPTANVLFTLGPDAQVTTAVSVLTFTALNWNIAQTVTVTASDDLAIEGTHGGVVSHTVSSGDTFYNAIAVTSITSTITDNDFPQGINIVQSGGTTDVTEGGASDTYTVELNSIPLANVVVALSPGGGLTATPTTLTFTPATWNVPQMVTVTAIDDDVAQGTRTVNIAQSATSGDTNYNGIAISAVGAGITDNDAASIIVSATTVNVAEGGASNAYTVRLSSQPTMNVVVTLNAGTQATLAPMSLVFTPANWNVAQTVTVIAIDDIVAEGPHTGNIGHSAGSVDAAYNGLSANVTAAISDNDNPGVLIRQTHGPMSLLEGYSSSYSAVLTSPPASPVTLVVSPDVQVMASPATIVFTPSDWSTPRPIVLTASDDAAPEGNHRGVVNHTTTSADAVYDGVTVASVNVEIVDNDGPLINGTIRPDKIVVTFTDTLVLVRVNATVATLPLSLGQFTINADEGADYIEINDPTVPVVVQGGGGIDRVFVNGRKLSNDFLVGTATLTANGVDVGLWEVESLVIGGGTSADLFTVRDVPSLPVEFKGNLGSDTVIGPDQLNTWKITTANGGTLDNSIKLNGIENWTGGNGADSFVFSAGKSLTGSVDGGGGSDVLDYSTATGAIAVNLQTERATGTAGIRNITMIRGGRGGADKLIGPDRDNVWSLASMNNGDVNGLVFQGFENLTGGSLDDAFLFADGAGAKGKIDGGLGSDTLDYGSFLLRAVSINLQTKFATGTAGFLNVEQFLGGSGVNDFLIGVNRVNVWNLTGPGSGDVSGAAFANFENFTGGSLADTFLLDAAGDWLGTINGGTGLDSLFAYPGGTNFWTIARTGAGTLNGRKFTNMETRR